MLLQPILILVVDQLGEAVTYTPPVNLRLHVRPCHKAGASGVATIASALSVSGPARLKTGIAQHFSLELVHGACP
jgi:hypothetical protein